MNNLKKYLKMNSLFSGISGLIMLLFSKWLNGLFDITNEYVFQIVGVNLLVFSVCVWFVSKRYLSDKKIVNLICILDGLWVFGSILIVVLNLFNLSYIGYFTISIVAIWIAYLGYNQFKYNN